MYRIPCISRPGNPKLELPHYCLSIKRPIDMSIANIPSLSNAAFAPVMRGTTLTPRTQCSSTEKMDFSSMN